MRFPALVAASCALLAGCESTNWATGDDSASPSALQAARAAQFYTPDRGPLTMGFAESLSPPSAPLKAIIYVPECASPHAPPDHIEYFQSLGHAVIVPGFGGDGCVAPEDQLVRQHNDIDRVVAEARDIAWIRDDAIYLVGHGVGADVASTYTRPDTFRGMIGLAAACPFGIQKVTPMITFRSLDDEVLMNRGTRCSQYPTDNALHVEFSGTDHALWLTRYSAQGGPRRLLRNSIARFIEAGDTPSPMAARTVTPPPVAADDGVTLLPESATAGGGTDVETIPLAPAELAVDTPTTESEAVPVAPLPPAASPTPATTDAEAPVEPEPAAPVATDTDVLYLPALQLPPGRY